MTTEEARTHAIRLKRRGATYHEVIEALRDLGAINPRTGRPYGRQTVGDWCRDHAPALGDQRGRRHKHLIGMTREERRAHDAEMHERKLERARQWRRENREYLREVARQYRKL